MMKRIVLSFLLALFFTAALHAAKFDDTTTRIDFTYGAGEFTQVSGPGGAAAPVVQAAAAQQGGTVKKTPEEPLPPSLSYFEFDLLSIYRSINRELLDINYRAGFGDYGNFGFQCAGDLVFNVKDPVYYFSVGIDMVFDFYPLGNAPSGWYMSLAAGGKMHSYTDDIEDIIFFSMPFYGATGYRLILGGFVADLSFSYGPEVFFGDTMVSVWKYFMRVGIGWVFDENPPPAAKPNAEKQKDPAAKNEKNPVEKLKKK